MKYTPPTNDWATGRRKTVMKLAAAYFKREYMPRKTTSMADLRWWRECNKYNTHRLAVGTLRAMGATAFFRGAYIGAEND